MAEALVKNPNEIHYVFLEGTAGVGKKVFIASGTELPLAGKTTLTSKLQKMGYTVHFEGFVELCKTYPQYPPTSTLMTLKWSQFLITAMEDGRRRHEKVAPRPPLLTAARDSPRIHPHAGRNQGRRHVLRPLLTPAVYARRRPPHPCPIPARPPASTLAVTPRPSCARTPPPRSPAAGLPANQFMRQAMRELRACCSTSTGRPRRARGKRPTLRNPPPPSQWRSRE